MSKYSQDTIEAAKKLLNGEDPENLDVSDPDELKALLDDRAAMAKIAADELRNGKNIDLSISYDGHNRTITDSDLRNEFDGNASFRVDASGRTSLIGAGYKPGEPDSPSNGGNDDLDRLKQEYEDLHQRYDELSDRHDDLKEQMGEIQIDIARLKEEMPQNVQDALQKLMDKNGGTIPIEILQDRNALEAMGLSAKEADIIVNKALNVFDIESEHDVNFLKKVAAPGEAQKASALAQEAVEIGEKLENMYEELDRKQKELEEQGVDFDKYGTLQAQSASFEVNDNNLDDIAGMDIKDLGFDENEITVALTNIEPENTALDHVKPLVVPGNNGLS